MQTQTKTMILTRVTKGIEITIFPKTKQQTAASMRLRMRIVAILFASTTFFGIKYAFIKSLAAGNPSALAVGGKPLCR